MQREKQHSYYFIMILFMMYVMYIILWLQIALLLLSSDPLFIVTFEVKLWISPARPY